MAILVAALIDQGKALSDKRSDGSVTDPDWLIYVNRSVESLWKLITSLDPHAFFAQSPDFALTGTDAGAVKDLTTLTRFRALHGLDLSPGTPTRRTVPRRNFRERNGRSVGWWTPTLWCSDRAYDLRAQNLVITPYEAAAGTYRAYFRQGPYQFTAAGDTNPLDAILEPHAEYLEIRVARRALGIEESNTGPLTDELAEQIAEITAAFTRDDGEPAVIADVEGDTAADWP